MQKEKKRLFSASENMKQEYCAEIVRIGEMKPIEGSDFLVQTIVDGFSIVVSKGEFTEGEPVIYCMNETALNKDFLSVNNQFEIGERDLNANAAEVNAIMDEYNEKYKNHADELRIKANQLKGSVEGMEKAIVKAKRTISKIEKESSSYTGEAKEKADADINELQEKIERLTESGKKKSEERAKLKAEIEQLVNDGKHIVDEAKKHVGFFNKYGRVKLIELRGCPSYGCIFKKETLSKWNRNVEEENLEDYLTVDENGYEHPFMFDMVGNKLFAEAYVPPIQPAKGSHKREKRRDKGLKKVKRVIEGEFQLLYDTAQLRQNMWKIKPETSVCVSVKMDGTSNITANVLTRIPNQLTSIDRLRNRMIKKAIRHLNKELKVVNPYHEGKKIWIRMQRLKERKMADFHVDYGMIYSSRKVVRNPESSKASPRPGFYSTDIWTEYGEILKPYIDKGMTVYGEICGYETGLSKHIQKHCGKVYDYGCKPGENFFMPYRITWKHEDGTKSEWNVEEVYGWTLNLIKEHPELAPRIRPIVILYHGTLGDLYPDIPQDEHWGNTVLERMANDTEHFGMELDEPLCNNKVPREGICIRIDDDPIAECFKLKTLIYLKNEQADIDAGNIDMEMMMAYGEGGRQ
jgi:ElaB/YqjD/DUF883 family membrane-anchored ribosome-binding protein